MSGEDSCAEDLGLCGERLGETVSGLTAYLVIGEIRSQGWITGPVCEAIQTAGDLLDQSGDAQKQISIVSEEHFLASVAKWRVA